MVYLKAIEAGCDIVDTAMSPLALGTSHAPTESIVAAFAGTEYDTGLDLILLNEIRDYFMGLREKYIKSGLLDPKMLATDANALIYQVPGGMLSNLLSQLKQAGKEDKLTEVLNEVPRVRKDSGYPPLVTPTSQIVGTQAVFNVINGERYKTVTKEFKALVKGEYGKTPVEISDEFRNQILKGEEPINCRPGELLEPVDFASTKKTLEDAIERRIDDQQLMSYVLYPHVYMDYIKHRKSYFDVSLLPTPVFFYGLEPGQEITVNLDEGKTLNIKLISVGSIRPDGTRTVYFELNGLARSVTIKDNSVQTVVKEREKADKFNKRHVGAPMPGKVFKLMISRGDKVSEGDVIMVTEAMKMETNIKAPISGTVKELLFDVGDAVEKGDLLVVLQLVQIKAGLLPGGQVHHELDAAASSHERLRLPAHSHVSLLLNPLRHQHGGIIAHNDAAGLEQIVENVLDETKTLIHGHGQRLHHQHISIAVYNQAGQSIAFAPYQAHHLLARQPAFAQHGSL